LIKSRVAVVVLILIGLAFESVIEDRNHGLKDANSSALELTRTLEAGLSATLQSAEVVVDYAVLAPPKLPMRRPVLRWPRTPMDPACRAGNASQLGHAMRHRPGLRVRGH
jgi:hypothetical protein